MPRSSRPWCGARGRWARQGSFRARPPSRLLAGFQAACRLRTTGPGPKGTASLLVETRPADDSGCP
eukprot:10493221-Alexandrium_andersonii.AAC.1